MPFTLDNVVPWGRPFEEYVRMFALSEDDLKKRILGCGDGPASFNSALTKRGGSVISLDPIYQFSSDEIRQRIDQTYSKIMEQTRLNQHEFVWDLIPSIERLGEIRKAAMNEFLSDYDTGKKQGRYIAGDLPRLPFQDKCFDLALCSHFLFLYSKHFSEGFHLQSIQELCRVASETRIFPLLELGAIKSRHLTRVLDKIKSTGRKASIEKVPYEFQKGGNEMLRVTS